MAKIDELSIVTPQSSKAEPVASGTQTTICDSNLCGSNNLTVYRRTVVRGHEFGLQAANDYHLLYVTRTPAKNTIVFGAQAHEAEQGAGVLLVPGEKAEFNASAGDLEMLHIVVPKPPAAIEDGLPGGPGYFFNRRTLRALSDASGGRIRRFCAESSIRRRDGQRITQTNAIQAGEMHYNEGGASPYHVHSGTGANPGGAEHCYITFDGRGVIEVENDFREIGPDTLVYIPPGIPHRLRAHGGPLDYFEIQAWRSFKTTILSEEPLGLKWFYDRESPGEAQTEWNQS
ncbi:MAG: cupin domain-containing protein [Pseudomonadota bacterium]|nr:cupin domain-containing protein [Pseudomonadota bacterium]